MRSSNIQNWSGKTGSNRRPQPWQGCALPTELFPLESSILAANRHQNRTHPKACSKSGAGKRVRTVDLNLGKRSEEHTSELQSQSNLVCRLLLEKKKKKKKCNQPSSIKLNPGQVHCGHSL